MHHFHFILCMKINLTIEALDFQGCGNEREEIDVLSKSISLLSDTDQTTVEELGKNSIGLFNFTYQVQNIANKNATTAAWRAVAILFILLTIAFLIISIVPIVLVRNETMKLKKLQPETSSEQCGK